MREILFRGKRLDNGEWVYGYYVYAPNHISQQEHLIQPVADDGRLATLRKVDPDTVGQFTGKFDKNGKRIFEGDICRVHDLNYKVEFKCSAWGFTILSKKVYCYPYFDSHCPEYCEIIGNIYDLDAVPVVRCGECAYCKAASPTVLVCYRPGGMRFIFDSDYCSRGQRRDQSAEARNMGQAAGDGKTKGESDGRP